MINVRAEETARQAVSSVLGLSLPTEPNTANRSDKLLVLWTGPDRWMVVSDNHRDAGLTDQVNAETAGFHANATLVSDQFSAFDIHGADVRAVLAQGCGIDLHPDRFRHGHCALCSFARTQVILIPQAEREHFQLLVESSLEGYLQGWFENAVGG